MRRQTREVRGQLCVGRARRGGRSAVGRSDPVALTFPH